MIAPSVDPQRATGAAPLVPDFEASAAFLDAWVALTAAQHVTLVGVVPDTKDCKGRTFGWPDHRDAALQWIEASNARANIYFSVNTARWINKKPLKADIETLVAVHVDLDPRKGRDFGAERARVLALADELAERPDPPTFVLDSGGGVQAFYVVTDPAAAEPEYVDEIEDLNHRLGAVLGDDGTTWNADRIMRLPGTLNHPNARKVANGQPTALACVLSSTGELRSWRDIIAAITRLEDKPPAHAEPRKPGERRRTANGHDARDFGGDLPPYATDEQLEELFTKLPHLAAVWDQSTCNPPLDDSPSGWDHRWASELAHEGYAPEMIASYLRAYRAHHEPHKGKQDRPDYIWRTVNRATRDRGEHLAAELNGHTARIEEITPEPEPAPEPEPVNLDAPAFYRELGEMVRNLDPLTEADPYGILAATLVMLGNWIGRRYHLRVGADRHYAAQQLILTGQSALSRKGTACSIAKAAMQVFDEEWHRDNIFYSLNSGQGIAHTVNKLNEAAMQTNANGDKRALFIAEEFADVLRKSQQKDNTILQVLRLAWDGATLENTSITHRIRVHGATVSMIGMITEAELRQLLDPAELATGSYNRMGFLVVTRSKVLPGFPPEITPDHFAPMRQIRKQIDSLPRQYQIAPDCISAPITLSPAAAAQAIDLKERWETEGKNLIEQASSRAFMHVLRYALIYAVIDGHKNIGPAHLEAAEHLVEKMADGVRRQATAELSDKIAERILTHMREDPTEMLSRTGISVGVFNRNVPARDLENAISTLMNLGLLRDQKVVTSGRPRTLYVLAPATK
jgi:Protein of unknown function (DUF3987)